MNRQTINIDIYQNIENISDSQKRNSCGRNRNYNDFRVFLHLPNEAIKNVMAKSFIIKIGRQTQVMLTPKMVHSSENLKSIKAEHRRCYFEGEKKLKYFKSYTENNCINECFSNFTLESCGCVSYNMLRNSTMKICQLYKNRCPEEAAVRFDKGKIRHQSNNNKIIILIDVEIEIKQNCNCFTVCTSLEYDDYTISMKDDRKYFKRENKSNELIPLKENQSSFALLEISFKETHFYKIKKVQVSDLFDFLFHSFGIFGKLRDHVNYPDVLNSLQLNVKY